MITYPDDATPLSLDEIDGLKFKHVTTRTELDQLEQANIESGLIWLKKQKNTNVLSEAFLKKLHTKLFGDVWHWAGAFRKTEKNIGIDPNYISTELRLLLDNVQYWIDNSTYSPHEIAARFHHKLVFIHLFPNGNGRHARISANALLTLVLKTKKIDWAQGYQMQDMNMRREEYIKALKHADKHDYKPLLKFIGIY